MHPMAVLATEIGLPERGDSGDGGAEEMRDCGGAP